MKTWTGIVISHERLRSAVKSLIKLNDSVQVIGVYAHAEEAIEELKNKGNAVIILGMTDDPEQSIRELKLLQLFGPYAILGVGDDAQATTPVLFNAFRLGMLDFIDFTAEEIDSPTDYHFREFNEVISAIGPADVSKISRANLVPVKSIKRRGVFDKADSAIAVGVPRGGVASAIKILTGLPRKKNVALFVSLPIPSDGSAPFIEEMQKFSEWPMKRIEKAQPIHSGVCYVTCLSDAFQINGEVKGGLAISPIAQEENPIDHMMMEVARTFRGNSMGVLLEGMGSDGMAGLKALKNHRAITMTIKKGGGVLTHSADLALSEKAVDFFVNTNELPGSLSFLIDQINEIVPINNAVHFS